MPNYTFICNKCGFATTKTMSVKDRKSYNETKRKCQQCNGRGLAQDYSTTTVSIMNTVGSLADKNSDKFSDDYKKHLNKKNNAYKYEGDPSENFAKYGLKHTGKVGGQPRED